MKISLIYGTTYSFTKECVQILKENIEDEILVFNENSLNDATLEKADIVIIGGSIYMGQIQKGIKDYCYKNLELLKTKKIALFLCCGLAENFETNLKNAFPEELLLLAFSKECFGGELRTDKMKFSHKIITKLMEKAVKGNENKGAKPLNKNIIKLANKINEMEMK